MKRPIRRVRRPRPRERMAGGPPGVARSPPRPGGSVNRLRECWRPAGLLPASPAIGGSKGRGSQVTRSSAHQERPAVPRVEDEVIDLVSQEEGTVLLPGFPAPVALKDEGALPRPDEEQHLEGAAVPLPLDPADWNAAFGPALRRPPASTLGHLAHGDPLFLSALHTSRAEAPAISPAAVVVPARTALLSLRGVPLRMTVVNRLSASPRTRISSG